MRRTVLAVAVLSSAAFAGPALADCTKEVAKAFQAQNKQKFLRKETRMISENGPVKMTLEYQLPDRMRQTVSLVVNPKPVQTILVGSKAWTQDEKGWFQLPPKAADQVLTFFEESTGAKAAEVGTFECAGAVTIDGKKLRAYRGINEQKKVFGMESTAKKNEAVRMVYIDPETGLPARAIYAREGFLDKPIYREDISFPSDIRIEPPKDVEKIELINPVKPFEEKK